MMAYGTGRQDNTVVTTSIPMQRTIMPLQARPATVVDIVPRTSYGTIFTIAILD